MRVLVVAGGMVAVLMLADSARWREGSVARGIDTAQAQSGDRALIVRGDSVFHGKLGGAVCATCHGQNAKGVAGMGPDLTDKAWLHGDGSLASIEATIRAGVAKPKKSAIAMPPFGGVPLDSAKVTAVAAYLHSLAR